MKNQTKKKILFLITKSNWGGAQRYVFDLATNLPTDNFKATVAVGGNGVLIDKLQEHKITVAPIKSLQRDIYFTKEISSFWQIAHLIRETDPDVLHVNSSKAGAIGALLGRLLGVPKVIYTAHGWAFNEDRVFVSKLLTGFLHWLTIICSHKTITVSDTLKKQMRWPFTAKKMHTVHNGLPSINHLSKTTAREQIAAKVPELTKYLNDPWTISIAELHPTKRHHIAIEAIAQVVTENPNVRHLIIGSGSERAALNQLIKYNQLQSHVFLIGQVAQAATYLKAADVFVHTSQSEALGYVIIESAQAKLPIVASNIGGIPEIVTHNQEATLIPIQATAAYAAAINNYLDNPNIATAHATAALKKSEQFTLQTMVAKTISLYQ